MREATITQEKIRHLEFDVPVCLPKGTQVQSVLQAMRESRQSCVLICEGPRCVGIFTERDFLSKVVGNRSSLSGLIDEVMSSNPRVLTVEDTVGEAIYIMNEFGYRNVPLVDGNGHCVGLLRIRNIIRYLAELFPEEILNLAPRSGQRFDQTDGG